MGGSRLEGSSFDEATGTYEFVVHGDPRDVRFWVMPVGDAWEVRIEGQPFPAIHHDRPWSVPDAARDAAVNAVETMLALERIQRDEERRSRS